MSSAVARVTPVINADPTAECHLLDLPPELREMIWSLVLVEPEPIISSVERRTISTKDFMSTTKLKSIRIGRPSPDLPSLAIATRSMCGEIVSIYFGRNTFLFHLDKRNPEEVSSWLHAVKNHVWDLLDGSDFEIVDEHITIRLEFAITNSQYFDLPAWVEYSYDAKTDDFGILYGGQLQEECVCRIRDHIKRSRNAQDGDVWVDMRKAIIQGIRPAVGGGLSKVIGGALAEFASIRPKLGIRRH
ncbi:hypothetical protein LTS10_000275 [Elasticomyces elasticus]|nr:hypothetical protein LTS10_000275 [Elasticomyces elasticus]